MLILFALGLVKGAIVMKLTTMPHHIPVRLCGDRIGSDLTQLFALDDERSIMPTQTLKLKRPCVVILGCL